MKLLATLCAILGVVLVLSAPAMAQQPPSSARPRVPFAIPVATLPVTLDGAVNERVWETALKLELNYEVRPGDNTPPPVHTEVFLAHDNRALFVAFRAHDDNPSQIRARFSDRDDVFDDDFVGIVLDTFNDERRAYEFMANPLGV